MKYYQTMERKLHLKVITLFMIMFCFSALTNFSQTSFNWVVGMGGTGTDQGYAIDKDSNGNIYAVGSFSGTANFGVNFTSVGSTNGFIAKIDPSGNYVWAKHLPGNSTVRINDVKLDASGNIYMTGGFNNGADFDMGVGTASLVTSILTTFVLKLDPSGNYLWAKKFDPLPSVLSNEGQSIECDASGNIYIAGEFNGIADFNPGAGTYSLTSNGSSDVYVTKLDASGSFIWAKQFGGPSGDLVNSMYLDGSGNVYTTGSFQGTVDFDPGAGATNFTANNTDIYISKLNSSGAFVYAKQIGGSGIDRGGYVCSDALDNVYATGLFASSVDFDPGAGTYSLTAASTDIYVLKLDASGNFSWANKFGAGGGAKMALNSSNDLFIIGSYSGTSDFNPGTGTYNLTSNGGTDVFISRLDNNGNFISALSIGGTGADSGSDIILDPSGEMYLFGNYNATMDANPFAGTYNITSFGGRDPFLLKLTDCSAPTPPVNTTNISNQTICSGTSAVLTATSSGTVNWYATSTSTTILTSGSSYTTTNLSAGNYTYYAAAVTCTTSTSRTAITVTVNASPTVSVNSGAICTGSSFTLSPSGASTYTYSSGSAIVSPTASASYSVTGTSAAGCLSSNTAVSSITVNAIPTISVNSGTICSGNSFTINPTGANTYTVSGGSFVVSPSASTSYTVTGTSSNGCVGSTGVASNVNVNSLPTISASTSNTLLCTGQTATLSASGASTYTWSNSQNTANIAISPTITTSYTLSGTDANGCTNSTIITQSVSSCTGLQNLNNDFEINIYPNPNNGKFTINLPVQCDMEIIDMLGSVISKHSNISGIQTIDISNYSGGVYFVKLKTNNNNYSIKRIIKN